MNYGIGEQIIHLSFGPGKIIAIDEKSLAGQTHRYYVIDTGEMTIWVQVNDMGEDSIRPLTGSFEFKKLFNILRSPGEGLPEHHRDRKNQLIERMNKRILVNICSVIRDLTTRSKSANLNNNDRSILKLAEEYLVDEWELSLGTARSSAYKELEVLLREDPSTQALSTV
ncbi:MAG: hypothetical protein ACM3PY_15575 [Omnitrophica WOR_2 bacterium]